MEISIVNQILPWFDRISSHIDENELDRRNFASAGAKNGCPDRRFRSLDPEGTCRKETEKTLDPAGIHWESPEHESRIPAGKFLDFFQRIQTTFLRFPPGTCRKSPEKIPKIFRPESCFHVPVTSDVFLPEPSRIL